MTTKQQEREALDKIRKIVDELGDDSYIATAFNGVLEIAEINIDNDWAVNAIERGVSMGKDEANVEIHELKEEIIRLQRDYDKALSEALRYEKQADYNYEREREKHVKCQEYKAEIDTLKTDNENQKNEIIKLKAKLYDMLAK